MLNRIEPGNEFKGEVSIGDVLVVAREYALIQAEGTYPLFAAKHHVVGSTCAYTACWTHDDKTITTHTCMT